MLKHQHLASGFLLAEEFFRAGCFVKPMPNTPMMQLASLTTDSAAIQNFTNGVTCSDSGVLCDKSGGELSVKQIEPLIDPSNTPIVPNGQETYHDAALQDVVKCDSSIIQNNIMLARNVVNPIVMKVIQGLESHLNEIPSVVLPLNIVISKWGNIWDSATIRTVLSGFEGRANSAINSSLPAFPRLSMEELLGHLKTGSASFDQDVNEWLGTLTDAVLMTIYEELFCSEPAPREAMSRVMRSRATYDNHNYAFAVALLAHSFLRKLPEGINGSAANIERVLGEYGAFATAEIGQATMMRNFNREKNVLVLFYPSGISAEAPIVVNGDFYDQWLEDGGKPAVILGAFFADKPTSTDMLNANAGRYQDVWSAKNADNQALVKDIRLSNIRSELSRQLNLVITEISDEHCLGLDRSAMRAGVRAAISNIYPSDVENLGNLVRRVVCNVMFPNTEVLVLLEQIDSVMKIDPTLNANAAAGIAVLRFIVAHVARQLLVDKVATK